MGKNKREKKPNVEQSGTKTSGTQKKLKVQKKKENFKMLFKENKIKDGNYIILSVMAVITEEECINTHTQM